ncbi:rubrerythrin family protein [Orenia metallireducens]|jgi:rubrerythrin|uniref:Rubrerythrin family protein n=1 Tax=Orenia metallireducens TaxID=1413210 RepID=A0A1C0AD38_9FIRM|nr:ferritin family protein [Orenia metallireducens]OCL28549.1 rubrerythrin family protein [Orenia metallireducens]
MSTQFNALEILKIAMNVEKQGENFYKRCVEVNSEPEVKAVFKELQEDEQEHYQYFKRLLEIFDEEDKSITRDYLYDPEVNQYLRALVDTKIFPDDEEVTDDIAHNLLEAIEVGIKAEKNSLLLYSELLEMEIDEQTLDALEKLIIEEKRHLIKLEVLKSAIS